MYSTLIATWCNANLSSAAQHLPAAAALEKQLDTTKPLLALLQKKICCYQTSYMSHLERASYWGGDQKPPWALIQKEWGTAHAFLYNVEVVRGYSKMEQFWAPTCSALRHTLFLIFLCVTSVGPKYFRVISGNKRRGYTVVSDII